MSDLLTWISLFSELETLRSMPAWELIDPEIQALYERLRHANQQAFKEIDNELVDLLRDTDRTLYEHVITTRSQLRASYLGDLDTRHFDRLSSAQGLQLELLEAGLRNTIAVAEHYTEVQGIGNAVGDGASTHVEIHNEQTYKRFIDLHCPQTVALNEVFVVRVALRSLPNPESRIQQIPVGLKLGAVELRLSISNCELIGSDRARLEVLESSDSQELIFRVVAKQLGRQEACLEIWQRGQQIANANFELLVERQTFSPSPNQKIAFNFLPWGENSTPDLRLMVRQWASDQLQFEFFYRGQVLYEGELVLADSLARLLRALFEQAGLATDLQHARLPALTPAQLTRRLEELGNLLWLQLLPEDFRDFYAAHRQLWYVESAEAQRSSFEICSEEIVIPWELVRPFHNGAEPWDETAWCETFYLARWLTKWPGTKRRVFPAPWLAINHMQALVDASEDEIRQAPTSYALPQALLERYKPTIYSLQATSDQTWKQIIGEDHDYLLHSLLSDNASELVAQLVNLSQQIEPTFQQGQALQRAVVLQSVHGHQQQAWDYGGIAWAGRLAMLGAGLSVATLWSVSPRSASCFCSVFYSKLIDEQLPVGAAMWHARRALKEAGEPFWPFYSLIAHPLTHIKFFQSV